MLNPRALESFILVQSLCEFSPEVMSDKNVFVKNLLDGERGVGSANDLETGLELGSL